MSNDIVREFSLQEQALDTSVLNKKKYGILNDIVEEKKKHVDIPTWRFPQMLYTHG